MEEHASDLAELSVCGQCASDTLAELPVPVIRQNFLSVDNVQMILQNCLHVEEIASDLAELPVPVICQICLHVDECASDLAELLVLLASAGQGPHPRPRDLLASAGQGGPGPPS